MSVKSLFPAIGSLYITDRLYSVSKPDNVHIVEGGSDRVLFKVTQNNERGGFTCLKLSLDKDFSKVEEKEEYEFNVDGYVDSFETSLMYRLLERVTLDVDESINEGSAGHYKVTRTGQKYESPQKQTLRRIAESKDIMEVIDEFKVGFELETQRSGGFTCNDWESKSQEIIKKKTDVLFDKAKTEKDFIMESSHIKGLLAYIPSEMKKRQLLELLDINDFEKLCDYFELTEEKASQDLKRGIRDKLNRKGTLAAFDTDTDGLLAKRDGTVAGFEFVPQESGVSVKEFMNLTEKLYAIDHDIDEKCSFHIHVSVNGVTHNHGYRLQQAMYEYLLFHAWDRVPESVKQRLQNKDWRNQYFKATTGTERYHLIAYRGETWEFRGFGNVLNAEDAAVCLQLALESVKHAYRVKFKLASLMYPDCKDYSKALDIGPTRFKDEMAIEQDQAA